MAGFNQTAMYKGYMTPEAQKKFEEEQLYQQGLEAQKQAEEEQKTRDFMRTPASDQYAQFAGLFSGNQQEVPMAEEQKEPSPWLSPLKENVGVSQFSSPEMNMEYQIPSQSAYDKLVNLSKQMDFQKAENPSLSFDKLAKQGENLKSGIRSPAGSSAEAEYFKKAREALDLSRADIDELKAKKAKLEAQGVDNPLPYMLAMASDMFNEGDNMAARMDPMAKEKMKQAKIAELEDQIRKGRASYTQDELSMLKQKVELEKERMKDAKDSVKLRDDAQKLRGEALKSDPAKDLMKIQSLGSLVDRYEEAVKKYGHAPTGENAADLDSLYNQILTDYKEYAHLGVIAGPDMGIMKGSLRSASGIKDWFGNELRGGTGGVLQSIKRVKEHLGSQQKFKSDILNSAYPGISEDPLLKNITKKNTKAPEETHPVDNMSDEDVVKAYNAKFGGAKIP